jgi:hypothetical protein
MTGGRGPLTGRLRYPVAIRIHLEGKTMPDLVSAGSWNAALGYLASKDFLEIRDRVEFVTITNREVPADGQG